jgi:hypothetical protein
MLNSSAVTEPAGPKMKPGAPTIRNARFCSPQNSRFLQYLGGDCQHIKGPLHSSQPVALAAVIFFKGRGVPLLYR